MSTELLTQTVNKSRQWSAALAGKWKSHLSFTFFVNIRFCGNCRTAKGPLKKRKEAEKKDEWKGGENNREKTHVLSIHSAPVELKIGIGTLAWGLHLKGHTWLSVLYGTLLVQDKAFWEQYYHLKKPPPPSLSFSHPIGWLEATWNNGGISRGAESLATEVLLGLQRNLSGLPSKALVRL